MDLLNFLVDKKSLSFILDKMEVIQDPLLRQLLWTSFSDLTSDIKMKSTDYLGLVSSKIRIENNLKLLQTVVNSSLGILVYFVPNSLSQLYSDKLFYSFYNELNKSTEKDFTNIWARAIVDFARSEATVKILEEQLRINNPAISQDLRWLIIQKLVAWGFPEAQEYLKMAQLKDSSDDGVRALLTVSTSFPDINQKRAAWERFTNPSAGTQLSAHQTAAEMAGFRWPHQESLLAEFTEKFFQVVPTIFKTREKEYANSFFENLFPWEMENPKVLELSNQLLDSLSPDDKHLIKVLKEATNDISRALKCRNLVLQDTNL